MLYIFQNKAILRNFEKYWKLLLQLQNIKFFLRYLYLREFGGFWHNDYKLIYTCIAHRSYKVKLQSDYIQGMCAKRVYYSHGSALRASRMPPFPLPTCTTAKVLFTRQRYTTLLCRARSKKSYQHGTGIISACLAPTAWILFVRVPCTTQTDVIRTARCYFCLLYTSDAADE